MANRGKTMKIVPIKNQSSLNSFDKSSEQDYTGYEKAQSFNSIHD